MKIWIRVGDADDYNSFDGYDEVAQHLATFEVKKINVKRYGQYGAKAENFKGNNYISLFWGDNNEPDPIKNLTDNERKQINRSIS